MQISKKILLTLTAFAATSVAQQTSPSTAATASTAANTWMTYQTSSPLSPDPFDAPTRAARDAYFDTTFGSPVAIQFNQKRTFHIGQQNDKLTWSSVPELPTVPNSAVVVGQFYAFESVLSQSQHSIYTEIAFTTDTILSDSSGQLKIGNYSTVIAPGGTVSTQAGVASYLTDATALFVQPGHRYVLVLSYNAAGKFYSLVKNWEIVNGVVQANSTMEQTRAKSGHAVLSGLMEAQLTTGLSTLNQLNQTNLGPVAPLAVLSTSSSTH